LPNWSSHFLKKKNGAAFVGTKSCEMILCMHLHWQPEFTCRHVSYSSEYRMSMLREQPSASQVYSRIQCSALQYSCQCNSDDYHTQDAWIYAVMTHEHRASAAQGHTNVSGSRQTRSCRETCAAKKHGPFGKCANLQ